MFIPCDSGQPACIWSGWYCGERYSAGLFRKQRTPLYSWRVRIGAGKHQNAKEKEEAAVLAQNEQLRANLLRAISMIFGRL